MMFSLDSSNELTGGLATKQAIYRLYKDVSDFLADIEVSTMRRYRYLFYILMFVCYF